MENQVVKPKVTVQMILTDLEAGLTRTSKDKHYKAEIGSIQDKYNLSTTELKSWFTHSKLKGRKVKGVNKNPFQYILVDEEEEIDPVNAAEAQVHEEIPHVEMEEVVPQEQEPKVVDNTPEAEVVEEQGFQGF